MRRRTSIAAGRGQRALYSISYQQKTRRVTYTSQQNTGNRAVKSGKISVHRRRRKHRPQLPGTQKNFLKFVFRAHWYHPWFTFYTRTTIDTWITVETALTREAKRWWRPSAKRKESLYKRFRMGLPPCWGEWCPDALHGVLALKFKPFTNQDTAKKEIAGLCVLLQNKAGMMDGIVQIVLYDDFEFDRGPQGLNDYLWITYTQQPKSRHLWCGRIYQQQALGFVKDHLLLMPAKAASCPQLKTDTETEKRLNVFKRRSTSKMGMNTEQHNTSQNALVMEASFFRIACLCARKQNFSFQPNQHSLHWLWPAFYVGEGPLTTRTHGIFMEPRFYGQNYNTFWRHGSHYRLSGAAYRLLRIACRHPFYRSVSISVHGILFYFVKTRLLMPFWWYCVPLCLNQTYDIARFPSTGFAGGVFFCSFFCGIAASSAKHEVACHECCAGCNRFFVNPNSSLVSVPFCVLVFASL